MLSALCPPVGQFQVMHGTEHSLEVALLVFEYRRGQLLLHKRHVVEEHGVAGRDVARLQQGLLALAQLATLVVGPRQVHHNVSVVVAVELLQAVLILGKMQGGYIMIQSVLILGSQMQGVHYD